MMDRTHRVFALVGLLGCALGVVPSMAEAPRPVQPQSTSRAPRTEVPRNGWVRSIQSVKPGGGRLDWSVQGETLAFDKRSERGYYAIYTMLPDGTGESCLTCPLYEFRKLHAFDPVWAPSGEYIVFTVQRNAKKLGLTAGAMTTPDRGIRSDLWIIDRTGKYYFQLTQGQQTGLAVMAPRFSHEGGQLLWSERVATQGGRWGQWILRVGQINIDAAVPRLKKVKDYRPAETRGFVEGHGFSPDDRRILIAGNLEPGQSEAGMDLYLFELATGQRQRLTTTLGEWDQLAEFAPTGEHIAFTSNRNLPRAMPRQSSVPPSARTVPRELWLMAPDGSGQQRLTFFNHPAQGDAAGNVVVADLSWSPDGDRIALQVVNLADDTEAIYIVELDASFRR